MRCGGSRLFAEKPPALYSIERGRKMGTTYDEITLINATDVGMEMRGLIKEAEVRQTTVQVVADTGADTLVINEPVRAALGLRIIGPAQAWLADGQNHGCQVTETVEVTWKGRSMTCRPWLIANAPEVLLGAIPMEDLDIIVDPNRQCLVGAHGDTQIRRAVGARRAYNG
jgi:predicted aspartyl protease